MNRMIKHFKYHDDWQTVELECPKCHWKGKFSEGAVGYRRELKDCCCPRCDFGTSPMLATVDYPTLDEMLASSNPADVQYAKGLQQIQQSFDAAKLVSKDQLPEVDSASFTLTWDFVEFNGEAITFIGHNDRLLFAEPASWEGYERFEEVCKIVREKYGARVTDLVPTPASELYLYGDRLSSPDFVKTVRQTIFARME